MATAPAARYVVPPAAIAHYRARGWCVLEDVVSPGELARIRAIADAMVAGEIDTRANRADLGGHTDRVAGAAGPENIIQIAWPTDLTSALDENELITAGRAISDALYGDAPGSWQIDMNQFLIKPPHSTTCTPLHIDQAYYIPLSDPRGCNIWLALADVTQEMGCLWFEDSPLDTPTPMRPHRPAGRGGGALECGDGPDFARMTAAPLRAGSVTVHSHRTPHYAHGNSAAAPRYGYVVQTRPAASVREARLAGFDHGRMRGNVPRAPNNVA
jgi:phytanoyl-CoA hydroxylase